MEAVCVGRRGGKMEPIWQLTLRQERRGLYRVRGILSRGDWPGVVNPFKFDMLQVRRGGDPGLRLNLRGLVFNLQLGRLCFSHGHIRLGMGGATKVLSPLSLDDDGGFGEVGLQELHQESA
jgi:hypothetical protein